MRYRALALFCLLTISSIDISAQQTLPNTFLWKITGKGMTSPSYMFGTIHLQDKTVFNFPDALYNAIEKSEGFALEVDMQEMMDSMFKISIREAENEILKEEEFQVHDSLLNNVDGALLKKFDLKPGAFNKKTLKEIRAYRVRNMVQKGDMQTIVDGYLYGIALRHGKIISGIEDINDQLRLMDELGGELTPDAVFQPDDSLKFSLKKLIDLYATKDLQGINDYIQHYPNREEMLVKRNIKMTRRMDSLMKIRTMVFAVGVGHLPGADGLINLLRQEGFTVEPVYSNVSVSPEKYLSKLSALPWQKLDQMDAYTIEMPGKPTDLNFLGEALNMKAFFDLPTFTFFMSGHTIGHLKNWEDVKSVFKTMAANISGLNHLKPVNISNREFIGGEVVMEAPQGYYRVRVLQKDNLMYFLMVGSNVEKKLKTKDAEHFFASFQPKAKETRLHRDWEDFSMAEKYFTISLPGKPKRSEAYDRQGEGSNWTYTTYDFLDQSKGLYYLIQIRDINEGYFLDDDSTYFANYLEDLSQNFEIDPDMDKGDHEGWPAVRLKAKQKGENIVYRILNVIRGNRIYAIMIGGQDNADFSDVDAVFNSLKLKDYEKGNFPFQSIDGLSTTAPTPFSKNVDSSSSFKERYLSYDPKRVVSMEIHKEKLPKYFWAGQSYLTNKSDDYKSYYDSCLFLDTVKIGNLEGREFIIEHSSKNQLKKVRLFVNGDTLYTLIAFLPKPWVNEPAYKGFFENFRLQKEVQPSIYENKAALFLQALQTKDTSEMEELLELMPQLEFKKADLPLLHAALLKEYISLPNQFFTTNNHLRNIISGIGDSSTISFVTKNYSGLKGNNEPVRNDLLYLLADHKTEKSYAILKDLLISDLPAETANNLSWPLLDSLALTRTLFPDILPKINDSNFLEMILPVLDRLIDSNMLTNQDILPYREKLYLESKRMVNNYLHASDKNYVLYKWINFLQNFDTEEANTLLKEIEQGPEMDLAWEATAGLINNQEVITEATIEKLASSKAYRLQLHEALKKAGRLKEFPSRYSTAIMMAESQLYQLASDDYEAFVEFIGEKLIEYDGKKQKFLLYRISYEENSEEAYLGIAGGYSPSSKSIEPDPNHTGIFWEETLDDTNLNDQLIKYLNSRK